jgi:hypothetical protein
VAIDQTQLDGMPLDAVRTLTVGPEGTFCTVQILRGGRCVYTYLHTYTWVFHIACVNIFAIFFEYVKLKVVGRASFS